MVVSHIKRSIKRKIFTRRRVRQAWASNFLHTIRILLYQQNGIDFVYVVADANKSQQNRLRVKANPFKLINIYSMWLNFVRLFRLSTTWEVHGDKIRAQLLCCNFANKSILFFIGALVFGVAVVCECDTNWKFAIASVTKSRVQILLN